MKTPLILASVAALLVAAGMAFRRRIAPVEFCNIAEGRHSDGRITYTADADHAERYSLVKPGTAATSTAICGSADVPIGVSFDAPLATETHRVDLFSSPGTKLMVASAAIAQDALVMPAASGRIVTIGTTTGTYWGVGRALTAASAAGQLVEVDMFFAKIVVP